MLSTIIKQRVEPGVQVESKVLEVRDVDVSTVAVLQSHNHIPLIGTGVYSFCGTLSKAHQECTVQLDTHLLPVEVHISTSVWYSAIL